ncbi:MAG: hypothetical protein EAY75_18200 [Bacteroidetes bacterium]|nr:MAG: hypothetical protein EAY75_18200 [Bacteroidota bacterium]
MHKTPELAASPHKTERLATWFARKAQKRGAAKAEAQRTLASPGQTPLGVLVQFVGEFLNKFLPYFW